jgi:hypothetical protein
METESKIVLMSRRIWFSYIKRLSRHWRRWSCWCEWCLSRRIWFSCIERVSRHWYGVADKDDKCPTVAGPKKMQVVLSWYWWRRSFRQRRQMSRSKRYLLIIKVVLMNAEAINWMSMVARSSCLTLEKHLLKNRPSIRFNNWNFKRISLFNFSWRSYW